MLETEEGRAEVLNSCGGNFGTAEYSMNYLFICQSFDISPKYWGPFAHSKSNMASLESLLAGNSIRGW